MSESLRKSNVSRQVVKLNQSVAYQNQEKKINLLFHLNNNHMFREMINHMYLGKINQLLIGFRDHMLI